MGFLPKDAEIPKILLGAEVLICDGIARLPDLDKLCLEGTNILLLEMPFTKWTSSVFESVEELLDRKDIRPIIAHAERYNLSDVNQLLEYEIPLQLNVDSFCGIFMPKPLKRLIEDGCVYALGSDLHGTEPGYKSWFKAEKKLKWYFDEIMEKTEKLIFG